MSSGHTMPTDPDAVRVQPQPKDERVISGQTSEINCPPTAKGGKGGPSYIAEQLWPLAVPIDTLSPDPSNARKHGEKNMAAIRASLSRFGQRAPIVVQRQGMVIRAGNGRWLAAKAMGWTQIAAVVVDDSSIDAVAFAIADNRTAELAEWDTEVLASLLDTMGEDDLSATGFDRADLDGLLAGLTPAVAPESSAQEIDAESYNGAHKCPKCGFEYD